MHEARLRFDFDFPLFLDLMDKRLDEAMGSLEEMGLFDGREYTEEYSERVESELGRLRDIQTSNRNSCEKWSWITWR